MRSIQDPKLRPSRRGIALACCLALSACAAGNAGTVADARTTAHARAEADARTDTDAGAAADAGPGADAGPPLFRDGLYLPSTRASQNAAARTQPVSTPSAELTPLPATDTPTAAGLTRRQAEAASRSPVVGGKAGAGARGGAGEKAVMNFVDTDIQSVVAALSKFLGRTFLLDPRVKGQITVVSDGEVPAATAHEMLVAALRMRGFAIVDVGNVSRVVPVADAKLQGGAVNARSPGGGVATRTIRLAYENAEALLPVLKPMIAPESSISAHATSNTLVVTDYVDNLERIARIVESIDTPASLDSDVVKVRKGVATDIAALANEMLQSGGADNRRDIVLLADPRSNSVVVRASSPARTRLARELIAKLDDVQGDPGNLHVVYLRNAQATSLSSVLRGLLTGDTGTSALGSGNGEAARAALGAGGMLAGAGASGGRSSAAAGGSADASARGMSAGANAASSRTRAAGASSSGGAGGQGGPGSAAFSANGVTVQADATTNSLIIAAPEPMYRSIRRVVDMLDQRRAQVMVESLIVEVSEQDAAQLGVQWMRNNGRFLGGVNLGGAGLNVNARNSIDLLPGGLNLGIIDGSLNLPGVGQILNLNLLARALQTQGKVNVLSTPNILTLDNESASIIVGKTVPFVSGQYITPGGGGSDNPFQTVTREDIGLQLRIRPQISEGGTVKLDIYQEVSNIDDQNSSTAGIVTNKRAIDTSVLLDDGQIMVLGGLLEDSVNTSEQAVPVLGAIPVLGHLFRYDKRQRAKTNLMVFLRPYVIRDANAGRGLTQDRYDFMRTQQSRAQPGRHLVLPDVPAPILPPADVPMLNRRSSLDLRPEQWPETRDQPAPATAQSRETRERPAAGEPLEPPVRSRLPGNVAVTADPTVLYATPDSNRTVLQVADVADQQDAVRIAKRVRVSGLSAYIVSGPGGAGYAVRLDSPRDARAVDTATSVLRELGYRPEIVVTP
ncbi:type II secretion system secretin GspD [Roseateles chitosanitabidus]|uniref:type II secretion system secretin GspD n=1 Tax=Roseateles chitosanitabidus TaxID=65048 RepID=UPI0023574FB9|nr:type II secretion system secretin GspD [Roseateles chitosanitabidus]